MKCNKLEVSCRDLKGSGIITQLWVKDKAEEMLHEPKIVTVHRISLLSFRGAEEDSSFHSEQALKS